MTINTPADAAFGTQPIKIYGTSGSTVYGTGIVLTIAPDFSMGPAPRSPTSQTISAGKTASFSLAFAPMASFTGTVNLSCAITPVVTPAPTCSLSSSSVQISGSGTQTVTVKVATTAATTDTAFHANFPAAAKPLTLMLLVSICLWVRSRKRFPALAAPIVLLVFLFSAGCGGSNPSSHTIPGTPAGTYTATITASSGSVSQTVPFTAVVR